jgi:hypothetical protein
MIATGVALSRMREVQVGLMVLAWNKSARRRQNGVLAEEVKQPETVNK